MPLVYGHVSAAKKCRGAIFGCVVGRILGKDAEKGNHFHPTFRTGPLAGENDWDSLLGQGEVPTSSAREKGHALSCFMFYVCGMAQEADY